MDMSMRLLCSVDGAVVERGKPTLVQDVAIQVSLGNQSLRSKSSNEHRFDLKVASKVDRHRRHSWHNVNEYRSVPYHQYSRSVQPGCDQTIQCDLDQEYSLSNEHALSRLEETEDENTTTTTITTKQSIDHATVHRSSDRDDRDRTMSPDGMSTKGERRRTWIQ